MLLAQSHYCSGFGSYDSLSALMIVTAKPKSIKGFNGKPARPITHAVYLTLIVQGHIKMLASLLVTQLGQHPIILGKPLMRKHGVILDMSCDKLAFWPSHCKHSDIRKKPPTAKKGIRGIALAPSLNKPMRGQEKVTFVTDLHPANPLSYQITLVHEYAHKYAYQLRS